MASAPEGSLAAAAESGARPLAEALAWLWRLGPVADEPAAGQVAVGTMAEADAILGAVRSGVAAGGIIVAPEPGPQAGAVPARAIRRGVARFAPGARVYDDFVVFADGRAIVQTRVGKHAVLLADRVLAAGGDVVGRWGYMGAYWALAPIEELLVELLDRPLLKLPPLGSVRIDDVPGTAQLQLEDREKDDEFSAKRMSGLHRTYRDAGARLSVAVPARALRDGEAVPLQEVWPKGMQALREGVAGGTFDPVCHGMMHFDAEASTDERIEPREFLRLDEAEAGRRIDTAVAWQREQLGEPKTFVAPAWGYSEGALAALAARGMPAWHRAAPGPLIVAGNPRETLVGAGAPEGGVFRLDYGSLQRLAAAGIPPTPVLHGGLLDDRLTARVKRDALIYARLLHKRDAARLPEVAGIRWIAASELVDRYRAHDAAEVRGTEPVLPDGAEAVLRDASGARPVHG